MPTTTEWRDGLGNALTDAQPAIELYSAYYDGAHRLQFATSKYKEAFGNLFKAFADNWCGLVVDGAVERLNIQGFRFGEDEADEEAWAIWQANGLDAQSIQAHTEAIKTGSAYLIVGPPPVPGGEPVISIEHPSQVIVALDPVDRRKRLAALKRYREVDGTVVAVVYEPDTVTTFRRKDAAQATGGMEFLGFKLPPIEGQDWDTTDVEENPTGEVLAIPLLNNPNLMTGGTSDLGPAISLNDAVNKFFTDMLHASEFTSFPQRVLTGVEIPKDPITGEVAPEEQIRAAVNRMWAFENPDSKVFDLQAGNLANYVEGIDLGVQHIAAQTRTPPHYLLAKMANLSGDALKAAETGLVARCRRKQIDFSDSWEDAMRLAFKWRWLDRQGWAGASEDLERAQMKDAEVIWVNPESRNPGTVGQELVMKSQVGVPQEILWEEAGYTPQQIKRMIPLRDAQEKRMVALQQAAAGGAPAEPQGNVNATETDQGLVVQGLPGPPAPEKAATNGQG